MRNALSSVIAIVVLTAIFGFGYPLVMTGFASVTMPHQAAGSLITLNGKVVGSRLAAQAFTALEVLPRAPVRHLARLQPGRDDVRQPRPDEPGSRQGDRRQRAAPS